MSSEICQKLLGMARKDIILSFERIMGFIQTVIDLAPDPMPPKEMICNQTEWKLGKCHTEDNKKCCGYCWYWLNDNKLANTTNTPDWVDSCHDLCDYEWNK